MKWQTLLYLLKKNNYWIMSCTAAHLNVFLNFNAMKQISFHPFGYRKVFVSYFESAGRKLWAERIPLMHSLIYFTVCVQNKDCYCSQLDMFRICFHFISFIDKIIKGTNGATNFMPSVFYPIHFTNDSEHICLAVFLS